MFILIDLIDSRLLKKEKNFDIKLKKKNQNEFN